MRPGQSYGDEIIRGIERSRCFILILSKASNDSPFVAREVERAVSKRKPIFPIRVQDVVPSSALELFISSTQWIDAFSDGDAEIGRLANLLTGEEGGESTPTAGATAPIAAARSGAWLRPALLAVAVLSGGLIGAFLWSTYGNKGPSVPEPAPASSTAEPIAAPPAIPPSPTSETGPERAAEPAVTAPQGSAAICTIRTEARTKFRAAQPELPSPHADNEDCSRSGDTTFCASSVLAPAHGNNYGPRNLADGDNNTAWVEGSDGQGVGDFVVLEFDSPRTISGLTVRNGYDKSPDIFDKNSRVKDIELRFSSGDSIEATLKDAPGPQHLALNQPIKAKWIELLIRSVYPGSKYSDTAINELRVDTQ